MRTGWSEGEILGLPEHAFQAYIDLLTSDGRRKVVAKGFDDECG